MISGWNGMTDYEETTKVLLDSLHDLREIREKTDRIQDAHDGILIADLKERLRATSHVRRFCKYTRPYMAGYRDFHVTRRPRLDRTVRLNPFDQMLDDVTVDLIHAENGVWKDVVDYKCESVIPDSGPDSGGISMKILEKGHERLQSGHKRTEVIYVAANLMNGFMTDADITAGLEAVTGADDVQAGLIGRMNFNGPVDIYTDLVLEPGARVLDDGDVYFLDAKNHGSCHSDIRIEHPDPATYSFHLDTSVTVHAGSVVRARVLPDV